MTAGYQGLAASTQEDRMRIATCLIVLALTALPASAGNEMVVDFAASLLDQQVERCGERESWMASGAPFVFFAPTVNPSMCPEHALGVTCWPDGCTESTYRYGRQDPQGELIVKMRVDDGAVCQIALHHQWIDETYCTSPDQVAIPGAYGDELIISQHPEPSAYSLADIWQPEWSIAYNAQADRPGFCDVYCPNPYGGERGDVWATGLCVGLCIRAWELSTDVTWMDWAWSLNRYRAMLAGEEVQYGPPALTSLEAAALTWWAANIQSADPRGMLIGTATAIDQASWGEIKATFLRDERG